jgi:hypothetical protein
MAARTEVASLAAEGEQVIIKALDAGDFCITGNITGDLGI